MIFEGISPGTALGLFAASGAILTGLHFLRSRYRRQPVATIMFWEEALKNPQRRTLFGRWSHWLSWLLSLFAALLLALALTEPVGRAVNAVETVIVVDASSADVYASAIKLLKPAVADAPAHFAVIVAAPTPVIVKNFDERFYPQRLTRIIPEKFPAQLDKTIYLAHTLLRDRKSNGRIVVLTPHGITHVAANGTPVTVITPIANPVGVQSDFSPLPRTANRQLTIKLAASTPTALKLLLESLPGVKFTTNDTEANLIIGMNLLLPDTIPAQIASPIRDVDGNIVAGKISPQTGFILRKSFAPDASTAADPAFAAAVARLIFDLAGQPLPGNIDKLEPGRAVALSPLLDVLPSSTLAVLNARSALSLAAWAGWLFAAALFAFAADAYLYAKNRNP